MSGPAVLEISVSEFKAKCLVIFKELEAHRLRLWRADSQPLWRACRSRHHSAGGDLIQPVFDGAIEAQTGDSFP